MNYRISNGQPKKVTLRIKPADDDAEIIEVHHYLASPDAAAVLRHEAETSVAFMEKDPVKKAEALFKADMDLWLALVERVEGYEDSEGNDLMSAERWKDHVPPEHVLAVMVKKDRVFIAKDEEKN